MDDVKAVIGRVQNALEADLEHGVWWMNDEAWAEFDQKYPRLNAALGDLFKQLEEA